MLGGYRISSFRFIETQTVLEKVVALIIRYGRYEIRKADSTIGVNARQNKKKGGGSLQQLGIIISPILEHYRRRK